MERKSMLSRSSKGRGKKPDSSKISPLPLIYLIGFLVFLSWGFIESARPLLLSLTQINMGWYIVMFFVALIFASIRQVNEYERGVKFTFGKFTRIMNPGWRLVIPIFQFWRKIDMRVKAVDVPDQESITRDNISVRVNAVIYYKVSDAQKAVIAVENYLYAMSQLAQTTMRNVVGEVDLDQLLANRETIAERIRAIIDRASDEWGIKVDSVDLKDVVLPEEMKRVIGKQAEAEREKRAVIIKAEGEVTASENLAKAAATLTQTDGALHLRTLQTLNDVSSDQSNTLIFVTPIEVLRAFERIGGKKTK